MTEGKHVVVCGAGIIGLCCAYYLRRQGHEVTVVERGARDHDHGALGSSGLVAPSQFVPFGAGDHGFHGRLDRRSPFSPTSRPNEVFLNGGSGLARASTAERAEPVEPLLADLNLLSRQLYEELAATLPQDFGLTKSGLLMVCRTQRGLEEEARHAAMASELGMPATVLTPRQAAALDPGLATDIAGAVHFPSDCHLDPRRFVAALTQALEGLGVRFFWNTKIQAWRNVGRYVRSALAGPDEISGDEFVVAGGSWSKSLVRGLGLTLPLRPGKAYSLTLEEPRQLPQLCSILTEAQVTVTPLGSALRIAGNLEFSGFDRRVRPERVEPIVRAVQDYFPAFKAADFATTPVWQGFSPCSPDGLPYLGRFSRFANLSVATGHARLGLSLAPVTGRIISQLLSGEKPEIPLEALSPDRYA